MIFTDVATTLNQHFELSVVFDGYIVRCHELYLTVTGRSPIGLFPMRNTPRKIFV